MRAPLKQGPCRRVAGQSRTPPAPDPAHLAQALGPSRVALGRHGLGDGAPAPRLELF